MIRGTLRRLVVVVALVWLAGCAGTGREGAPATAASADPVMPLEMGPILDVPDPFEPFNRAVYRFNFELDHYVLLPVVDAYRAVVPSPVRTGVSNFFSNLLEVRNATNGLLQARPEVTSRAVIRFLVNSTIGVLGLFDVATELGVHEQREDFGQTLGWWGVPHGPFLVLPVVGPSGVRDATGLAADTAAGIYLPPGSEINDTVYSHPAVLALFAIDARYAVPFRYYATGSPFEYELVRFLYRQHRDFLVQQ